MENEERSGVSWGGVFSGAFVGLAVFMTLLLLGSAIGFSVYDPSQGFQLESLGIGAGIYVLFCVVLSFFLMGYTATKLSRPRYTVNAALQGLTSWAVVITFFGVVAGAGVGAGLATVETNPKIKEAIKSQTKKSDKLTAKASSNLPGRQELEQKVRSVAAGTTWFAFFILTLSGISALLGGIIGNPIRRINKEATRPTERRAA